MRILPLLSAVLLCAAPFGAAYAQTAVVARGATGTAKLPGGMSFNYDAQHSQITATGVQLSPSAAKLASVAPTTGTIHISINIKVASRFTTGTTYHCSAYVLGGIIDTDNGTVQGGIETANGFGTVNSAGNVNCSLTIPYAWTLSQGTGADSGLILAYAAAAVNTDSEVQRSTLQLDGIENLPASGTASSYAFEVVL